jgi:hypothetical protein
MERREEDEQPAPGPHEHTDEETHEDAGMPGGGGATAPSEGENGEEGRP